MFGILLFEDRDHLLHLFLLFSLITEKNLTIGQKILGAFKARSKCHYIDRSVIIITVISINGQN